MKKAFRLSAMTMLASAALVTAAVPALASVSATQAVINNSQSLKAAPSSAITTGGSSFDANLLNAAISLYALHGANNKNALAAYASTSSGTGRASMIAGNLSIGFSDVPLNYAGVDDAATNYVQVPVALGGVAIISNLGFVSSVVESAVSPNTGADVTDTTTYGTSTSIADACKAAFAKNTLTLDGATLAGIFHGEITQWNDNNIVALNPKVTVKLKAPKAAAVVASAAGVKPVVAAKDEKFTSVTVNCLSLASQETIKVISRTAGSGTTFMFTDYLNQVSPVKFPTATQAAFSAASATASNSANLATAVHGTDGSIGYVEYGYALLNQEVPAKLKNASGATVALNAKSVAAAASDGLTAINANNAGCTNGFSLAGGTYVDATSTVNTSCFSINNASGAKDWPIAGFSYAITPKTTTVNSTNTAIAKFLVFLTQSGKATSADTTFGQNLASAQAYVSLPSGLSTVAYNALAAGLGSNVSSTN
jgi:phosphate transport system substrate-binding protein